MLLQLVRQGESMKVKVLLSPTHALCLRGSMNDEAYVLYVFSFKVAEGFYNHDADKPEFAFEVDKVNILFTLN